LKNLWYYQKLLNRLLVYWRTEMAKAKIKVKTDGCEYPLLKKNSFRPPEIPARLAWSASSLKLFRKCKRKWYWRYIMRLKPKWSDSNLLIGTATHEALGVWYKNPKASPKQFMRKLKKEYTKLEEAIQVSADYFDQDELDKSTTAIKTFQGMVRGYVDIYQNDFKNWVITPKDVEAEFSVNLGDFDFKGFVDLTPTNRKTKKSFIVEHKTARSIGDSYIDRLPLDTQVRGYIFGARKGLGLKPTEVIYDVIRKCSLRRKADETQDDFNERIALDYASRPDFYFFREPLKFSKDSIDAFEHDLHMTHNEYEFVVDNDDYLNPTSWVCSDHICNEFFKTCPYLSLCLKGLDKGTEKLYNQSEIKDDLVEEE